MCEFDKNHYISNYRSYGSLNFRCFFIFSTVYNANQFNVYATLQTHCAVCHKPIHTAVLHRLCLQHDTRSNRLLKLAHGSPPVLPDPTKFGTNKVQLSLIYVTVFDLL